MLLVASKQTPTTETTHHSRDFRRGFLWWCGRTTQYKIGRHGYTFAYMHAHVSTHIKINIIHCGVVVVWMNNSGYCASGGDDIGGHKLWEVVDS